MKSVEVFGALVSFALSGGLVRILELSICRHVENPSEKGTSGQNVSVWVLYLTFGF